MKRFFLFQKKVKISKEEKQTLNAIFQNAISMTAFYEKGKVKITTFTESINPLTGSDVVYG